MAEKRTVNVLERHIRTGVAGDCHGCAVALALIDATGDANANVYTDSECRICLEANSWSIVAPECVGNFVREFDRLPRESGGRVIPPAVLAGTPVAPFAFDLPADDDPAWGVSCERCYDTTSLHDLVDNACPSCRGE